MKKIELLQNLPIQTYKFNKYDFVIKLDNKGYYSICGYRWNHKRTYVVSTFENEILFSHLDLVKNMISYLITDKIF
jgi:hypothetical protein